MPANINTNPIHTFMESFKKWLEMNDAGPFDLPAPSQDRMPHLIRGGLQDKKIPKQMRPEPITSGFPTYGGPPLPKISRRPVAKST